MNHHEYQQIKQAYYNSGYNDTMTKLSMTAVGAGLGALGAIGAVGAGAGALSADEGEAGLGATRSLVNMADRSGQGAVGGAGLGALASLGLVDWPSVLKSKSKLKTLGAIGKLTGMSALAGGALGGLGGATVGVGESMLGQNPEYESKGLGNLYGLTRGY
tara:strand:- start:48 stop:527 length:480 start_codon:yes stop_codon:yes gene_type:complete